MVWKARKKTVEDIINLFDFERLYQTIQREGNLTRIPKEKRIIYRLLFLKIYYPVYVIFRIKYGEK